MANVKKEARVTDEQFNEAQKMFVDATGELQALKLKMQDQAQKIADKYNASLLALEQKIQDASVTVETYCKQNDAVLFVDTKKTITTEYGKVNKRKSPPSLVTVNSIKWDEVIANIKKAKKAKDFIKTKEEVDKKALLDFRDTPKAAEFYKKICVEVKSSTSYTFKPADLK